MDAIIVAGIEIFKCIGPSLSKHVQYHKMLHKNMEILRRKSEELNSRKEDIELRLKTELHVGKSAKAEVKNWLENTQRINKEVQKFEQKFKEVKCYSRARLGKLVVENIQEVEKHYESGSSFESLVIDAAPSSGLVLPTPPLVGETTAKKNMDEIWEYLMGNEVFKIGVCGMGGAGKTTIITHINNRLLKETNKFTNVIWVTVSQPLDLMKLHNQIATALNEDPPKDESEKIRAGKVVRMLENKKFVLILDDMWEQFPLEKVGIPQPTQENGCKLVITTRSLDVCRFMECRVVNVKLLPENEAMKLFLDQVGDIISRIPTLVETVKPIVKQCASLPLAIVTVASCMKGEEDICEWRNALEELSQNIKNVKGKETNIPVQLKFSYDRLKDKKVQHCFLYCALYPEDFKIKKKELIGYWIAEGLADERSSMQATYDKGYFILNRLVNNCSLDIADDKKCVKMHDLIRDMALNITSESPLFMVKANMKLREFPREQEWRGNLERVSLMRNYIFEIPSDLSPNCRTLSTLLLQGNTFQKIPESFFMHMPKLMVLDLSGTAIVHLPNSISELRSLTALLLNHCWQLKHVPSLAKNLFLRRLELNRTWIRKVPAGMKLLENLRYLDLYDCYYPLKVPAGMLPNLYRLQDLRVPFVPTTSRVAIEEVAKLSQLEAFKADFSEIQHFNMYVKCLEGQGLAPRRYKIYVSQIRQLKYDKKYSTNKCIMFVGCNICEGEDSALLPEDVQQLRIYYCEDLRSLSDIPLFNKLSKEGGHNNKCSDLNVLDIRTCRNLRKLFSPKLLRALQNLEEIYIRQCHDIEELITFDADEEENSKWEGTSNTIIFTLPKLRRSTLYNFLELKSISNNNNVVIVCDSLQYFEVYRCEKLKRLPLSLSLPAIKEIVVTLDNNIRNRGAQNLEEIVVDYCDEIEEIITLDIDEEKNNRKEGSSDTIIFTYPKLRKMTLRRLPKLKYTSAQNLRGSLFLFHSLQSKKSWCKEIGGNHWSGTIPMQKVTYSPTVGGDKRNRMMISHSNKL